MTIDLTSAPQELIINLTRGADFIRILKATAPETFPAGAVVSLIFYSATGTILTTWNAVVTSADATWSVDKADVDTLIAQNPATCRLMYIDGVTDLLWALATTVSVDG